MKGGELLARSALCPWPRCYIIALTSRRLALYVRPPGSTSWDVLSGHWAGSVGRWTARKTGGQLCRRRRSERRLAGSAGGCRKGASQEQKPNMNLYEESAEAQQPPALLPPSQQQQQQQQQQENIKLEGSAQTQSHGVMNELSGRGDAFLMAKLDQGPTDVLSSVRPPFMALPPSLPPPPPPPVMQIQTALPEHAGLPPNGDQRLWEALSPNAMMDPGPPLPQAESTPTSVTCAVTAMSSRVICGQTSPDSSTSANSSSPNKTSHEQCGAASGSGSTGKESKRKGEPYIVDLQLGQILKHCMRPPLSSSFLCFHALHAREQPSLMLNSVVLL